MSAVPINEIYAGPLSASVKGRPIQILNDYTDASDVTVLHIIPTDADQLDEVWVKAWNNDTARHDITVSISPATTSSQTDITAAALVYTLPAKGWAWILAGERLRLVSGTSWAIAAHVVNAVMTGKYVSVTGWVQRTTQTALS